jgi:hypothetical protein
MKVTRSLVDQYLPPTTARIEGGLPMQPMQDDPLCERDGSSVVRNESLRSNIMFPDDGLQLLDLLSTHAEPIHRKGGRAHTLSRPTPIIVFHNDRAMSANAAHASNRGECFSLDLPTGLLRASAAVFLVP